MDIGRIRIARVVLFGVLGTPLAGLSIAYVYMSGSDFVGMPMVPIVAILLLWGLLVKQAMEVQLAKAKPQDGCEVEKPFFVGASFPPTVDAVIVEQIAEEIMERVRKRHDLSWLYEPMEEQGAVLEAPLYVSPNPKAKRKTKARSRRKVKGGS